MAVSAHTRWINAGKPLQPAQPIVDIVAKLKVAYTKAADAYQFSWYSNDAHYLAVPPEDHTPYSETGWPLVSPEWWVFATDIMHRPDLGVDCDVLFAYWLAEARAGRMPWLKYMNWQGKQYRAKGYGGETVAFQTAWSNSGHFDHIHLSSRTDHRDTSLGSWSITPTGDNMAINEADLNKASSIIIWNLQGWVATTLHTTERTEKLLTAIAAKVDIDAGELEQIKQATASGVAEVVKTIAPLIAKEVMAMLPAGALTLKDVEQAVHNVLEAGLTVKPTV